MVAPAYVGLGANAGPGGGSFPEIVGALWGAVQAATSRLHADAMISSLYRTAPVGEVLDQPEFYNAVMELHFQGKAPSPRGLLEVLLDVERQFGRDRTREVPGGPRAMDLDFLVWGDLVVDDPGPPALTLPHPRLARRAFALQPLVELAGPDLVIPGAGRAGDCLTAALRDPAQRIVNLSDLGRKFPV